MNHDILQPPQHQLIPPSTNFSPSTTHHNSFPHQQSTAETNISQNTTTSNTNHNAFTAPHSETIQNNNSTHPIINNTPNQPTNPSYLRGPVEIMYSPTDFDEIPNYVINPSCREISKFLFGTKPGGQSILHISCIYHSAFILFCIVGLMSLLVYSSRSYAYQQLSVLDHAYVSYTQAREKNDWLTTYTIGDLNLKKLPPLLIDQYHPQQFPSPHQQLPLDHTSPYNFEFAVTATDLYKDRYLESRSNKLYANQQLSSTSTSPTMLIATSTPDQTIDQLSTQFTYYHDRSFFAMRPVEFIPYISLKSALFVESFLTQSFYPHIMATLDSFCQTFNSISLIQLPQFITKFVHIPDMYYNPPLNKNEQQRYLQSNNNNNNNRDQTFLAQFFASPLMYFVLVFVTFIGWGLLHIHVFHESFLSSHVQVIGLHATVFTSIHFAFVIMYRYYIYQSTFLHFFSFIIPYVIHLYYQFEHIIFGSFPQPFVFLKIPIPITVTFVYMIFIFSGWLLSGDLLKGDFITIFVIYLLPLFISIYFVKGTLELYTIIDKLQINLVTSLSLAMNQENQTIIDPESQQHSTRHQSSIQQSFSSNTPRSSLSLPPPPPSTSPPPSILPILPTSMAKGRAIQLMSIAFVSYCVILLTYPLGITHIYISIAISWTLPALYQSDFWGPTISIERTKLPEWMQDLDIDNTFGHGLGQYAFVSDDQLDSEQLAKNRKHSSISDDSDDSDNNNNNTNTTTTNNNKRNIKISTPTQSSNGMVQLINSDGKAIQVNPNDYIPTYKHTDKGIYTSIIPQNPLHNHDSDLSEFDEHDQQQLPSHSQKYPYPPPHQLPSTFNDSIGQYSDDSEDDYDDDDDDDDDDDYYHSQKYRSQRKGFSTISKATSSKKQEIDSDYDDDNDDDDDDDQRKYYDYLHFNKSRLGCTSNLLLIFSALSLTFAILITSGQIGLFQQQFDLNKPDVYSIITPAGELDTKLLHSKRSVQASQPFSTVSITNQNINYSTNTPIINTTTTVFGQQQINLGDYDSTISHPVNPELEQVIENIYKNQRLNPGWANLASGCYGFSSLTSNIDISSPDLFQSKLHYKLDLYEDSITDAKIRSNVELNMLKDLFFKQYKGLRSYITQYNDQLSQVNFKINAEYPHIKFEEIVKVIKVTPGSNDKHNWFSRSHQSTSNDGFEKGIENDNTSVIAKQPPMTVLYTISPTIPRYEPLREREIAARQSQSTLKSNQDVPDLNSHISLALPYHLLYSLYTHHYSTFSQDSSNPHTATKQQKQKYLLDSVLLPIRARWHSYSSVSSIDEFIINCSVLNIDGSSNPNQVEEYDIKIYLLSYLSCDRHVAQSVFIDEDITILKKCFKQQNVDSIDSNPVMDSPIQPDSSPIIPDVSLDNTKQHSQQQQDQYEQEQQEQEQPLNTFQSPQPNDAINNNDDDSQVTQVIVDDSIYFSNPDVNIAMRFLLSHFENIVEQHDRRQQSKNHPSIPPSSSSSSFIYANDQTITTPLSESYVNQIDYANHYFATTFTALWCIICIGLFGFWWTLCKSSPKMKYI